MFFVQPSDIKHVGDFSDFPPPIALLLHGPEHLITLKDRLDILNVFNGQVLAVSVEQNAGIHQPNSLIVTVPNCVLAAVT